MLSDRVLRLLRSVSNLRKDPPGEKEQESKLFEVTVVETRIARGRAMDHAVLATRQRCSCFSLAKGSAH